MSKLEKPTNYKALLDLKQTELAIKKIKDFFINNLLIICRINKFSLPLHRVSIADNIVCGIIH